MEIVGYVTAQEASLRAASSQREQLERWAARHRARLIAVHEDRNLTDGPLYRARPALMDALALLRSDAGARALLLPSRHWLGAHDEALVEGLARRAGGRVIAVDGSTPSAAVEQLVETCEAYARALSSVGTRAKRREWTAKGAPYGAVPWGFRASADGKRLVRDEAEQRVLSVVVHMRAEGFKLREIAGELARAGLRTRRGGKISIARVSELLQDIERRPLYEEQRLRMARAARAPRS
jgi:hypothetical protein